MQLDLLVSHFGVEGVAEMTGRKMRIVTKDGRTQVEPRAAPGVSHEQESICPLVRTFACLPKQSSVFTCTLTFAWQVNILEKNAFLSGEKRVAVISEVCMRFAPEIFGVR